MGDAGIELISSLMSGVLPVSNQSDCQILDVKGSVLSRKKTKFFCDTRDPRGAHGASVIL